MMRLSRGPQEMGLQRNQRGNSLCEKLQHHHSAMLDSSSRRSRGKGTFTAGRMQLLVPALPFALRDLLGQEIALLRRELGKPATASLVGPSTHMVQALNRFLDWFVMARQIMITVADVPKLQRRALAIREELQRLFPEKPGEKSTKNRTATKR